MNSADAKPAPGAAGGVPAVAKKGRKKRSKVAHDYPVEPRVIQVIHKPKSHVNHSYRDFSIVPPEVGYEPPTKLDEMTFAQKLHFSLSQEENENSIAWMPHGRAFIVKVPILFERKLCEKFFGHKRYSSFLRGLNNHGFKHITKGTDRNCYYHECFLRGLPHLCRYMPEAKDARRLIPDPENEPNFYAISNMYPVSAGAAQAKPVKEDKKPAASAEPPVQGEVGDRVAPGDGTNPLQVAMPEQTQNGLSLSSLPFAASPLVAAAAAATFMSGTPAPTLAHQSLLNPLVNAAIQVPAVPGWANGISTLPSLPTNAPPLSNIPAPGLQQEERLATSQLTLDNAQAIAALLRHHGFR